MPEPIRRKLAACPHCGIRVFFNADGLCPSCGRDSSRPPDAESTARILANQEDIARRASAKDHRVVERRRTLLLTGMMAIGAGLALTWLTVSEGEKSGAGGGTIFYGLVVFGLFQIGRAASLHDRPRG